MTAAVVISLDHKGRGSLIVDGKDLSNGVGGLTLRSEAGKANVLTLDVIPHVVSMKGEVKVIVSDASHDALVAIGWTPPGEPAKCLKHDECTLPGGHSFQCRGADRQIIPGPTTWNSREGRHICNTRTPCDHCLTTSEESTND
jgi:hypothetical protein